MDQSGGTRFLLVIGLWGGTVQAQSCRQALFLTYGAGMLTQQDQCWQLTIDVSGDGRNNTGPTPMQAYALDGFERVTVNALVVGDPIGFVPEMDEMTSDNLRTYFEAAVIRGPKAFAMIAHGYGEYADAMRRKLICELSQPMVGLLVEP